jgi:hypothetical protein
MHEYKEQCAQQELIRDRIEILAEHRPLMQQSRQQAIESITDPSEHKECERSPEMAIQYSHNEEGNNAETQEGELVGRSPEVFQHGSLLDRTFLNSGGNVLPA